MSIPRMGYPRRVQLTILAVISVVISLVSATRAEAADPIPTCTPSPTCVAPALLNERLLRTPGGLYEATDAQIASLRNVENAALDATLADHQLPSSDRLAVQTWGRADAEGELWAILAKAARSSNPTPDERNALDWLLNTSRRKGVADADAAGWEFLKWAGLVSGVGPQPNHDSILALVNQVASGALVPVAFNTDPATTTPTSGYCVYKPPAPTEAMYTGNLSTPASARTADQWCFAPYKCVNPLGCRTNEPPFENFMAWGEAESNGRLTNTTGFAVNYVDIGTSQLYGLGVVLAGAGIGLVIASSLAAVISGTFISTLLFPFLTTVADFVITSATTGGVLGAEAAAEVAAAALGGVVTIVIIAIAIAVLEGIRIAAEAELPGKIRDALTHAASSTSDISTIMADDSLRSGLYPVFVGATSPLPAYITCDNDIGVQISGQTVPTPCLNAPPLTAATFDDPQFEVTAEAEDGSKTTSVTDTLYWSEGQIHTQLPNAFNQHQTTVRRNWFVDDAASSKSRTPTRQLLHVNMNDLESGFTKEVWLSRTPAGAYTFVTVATNYAVINDFNPDLTIPPDQRNNCQNNGLCTVGDTIHYISANDSGTSLTKYTAKIIPRVRPNVIVFKPTSINEGSPASYSGDSTQPLTYQWYFRPYRAGQFCAPGDQFCGFDGPFNGSSAQYTWSRPGIYDAVVIASDPDGRQVRTDFKAQVNSVAPELTVDPLANSDTTLIPGLTRVDGSIDQVGADDSGRLTIDWGDGVIDGADWGPDAIGSAGAAIEVAHGPAQHSTFGAAHRYNLAGTYVVSVRLTDEAGNIRTVQRDQHVFAVSSTTITADHNPAAQQQPVTYTAQVTANAGQPTGTVTFTDSEVNGPPICTGVPLSPSTFTAQCTISYPQLGHHSIVASYSGDARTRPSDSPALPLSVDKIASTVQLRALPGSAIAGQPITLTATITPPQTTGFVTFSDADGVICQAVPTALDGTATCTTSFPVAVAHSIVASFSGYDIHQPADSAPLLITVAPATAEITVTATPTTAQPGQSITYRASLSSAGPPLTGFVQFFDGPASTPLCSADLILVAELYTASCSSALPTGAHLVSARYLNDPNTSAARSDPVTVVVVPATSSTTLPAGSTPVGSTSTIIATVTSPTNPVAGTVSFTDGSTVLCANVSLTTSEPITATCTTRFATVGKHTLVAGYSGDAQHVGSTSTPTVWTVTPAASTWTLTSNPSTLTFGSSVRFTAKTTPTAGLADPTGTVTFTVDGKQLGSAVTVNSRQAVSTIATGLAPGPHTIAAHYSGDGVHEPSRASLTTSVGCTKSVNGGKLSGNQTVSGALCLSGATVTGTIVLRPGAALSLNNAVVQGGIVAAGATAIRICGSRITGAVAILLSNGPVVVGNPADCAANTLHNSVGILDNRGGVTVGGNVITGNLVCTSNVPVATSGGSVNIVSGLALGECAGLATKPPRPRSG